MKALIILAAFFVAAIAVEASGQDLAPIPREDREIFRLPEPPGKPFLIEDLWSLIAFDDVPMAQITRTIELDDQSKALLDGAQRIAVRIQALETRIRAIENRCRPGP